MKKQENDDELRCEKEKKEARESGNDFRFRRRELLQATTERATWGDRRATRAAAIDLLEAGKTRFTQAESELLRRALLDYKAIDEAFLNAGIHARELFPIIDEAGKLYRAGSRSEAARMLTLTTGTGKREPTEDHNSIVATYLLQVGMGVSKNEAVEKLVTIFSLTSRDAAIQILKRNKKRLPSLPLPNTWKNNY